MSNPTELLDRLEAMRAALNRISETRFGWDGDCGVTSIAYDALSADDEAAHRAQPEDEAPQADTSGLPLDVEFKQLADTILQATTNGTRLEALRGMAALFDKQAEQNTPAATLSPLCGAQHAESGKEKHSFTAYVLDCKAAGTVPMTRSDFAAQQAAAPAFSSAPGTPEAPSRDDVLEEAALACESQHRKWRWDDEPDSASGPRDCAAAIRNLKRAAQLDGGQEGSES